MCCHKFQLCQQQLPNVLLLASGPHCKAELLQAAECCLERQKVSAGQSTSHAGMLSVGMQVHFAFGVLSACTTCMYSCGSSQWQPLNTTSDMNLQKVAASAISVCALQDFEKGDVKQFRKACQWYETLGQRMAGSGHCLDVFACSLDQVGIAEMHDAISVTGEVVTHVWSAHMPLQQCLSHTPCGWAVHRLVQSLCAAAPGCVALQTRTCLAPSNV